jgi:hypothetical protein
MVRTGIKRFPVQSANTDLQSLEIGVTVLKRAICDRFVREDVAFDKLNDFDDREINKLPRHKYT